MKKTIQDRTVPEEAPRAVDQPVSLADGAHSQSRPKQPTLFQVVEEHPDDLPITEAHADGFLDSILSFEGDPSPIYIASLLIGSALILAAAALELFPWIGSALGVTGLLATMFRGGRWATLACALAVVVVVTASLWPRELTLADVGPAATSGQSQAASADDAPEGSLGIRLSELADLWNALDQPPTIGRGFSRSLDRGPLDGFVLRFDDGASLAGAYDPSDDYVYALWTSTRLEHEAISTMYLHLCFLLHPYSQDCIDTYWADGMDGKSPADYHDAQHSAEWQLGDETWRLAILGNIQEIRVLGDHPGELPGP